MRKVKIAHISDLHLSNEVFGDGGVAIKGTAGHSIDKLVSLTKALKEIEWDLLLITGDISKNGSSSSFSIAKTWLDSYLVDGKHSKIGLELDGSDKNYLIVPGNHDYYNGTFIQENNDNYLDFFEYVGVNTIVEKEINSVKVKVHLYDSTKKKRMAKGELREKHKTERITNDDDLDIAMLHHHILMPPNISLTRVLELENVRSDTKYLLSCGFNSILFGHTHRYFQDYISDRIVIKNFPVKRGKKRLWRDLLKLKIVEKSNSVSYERKKSQNGQYPDFNSFMEYLYIKKIVGDTIKGPNDFCSIKGFYDELKLYKEKNGNILLDKSFERNLHISMAESACQKDENSCSFNTMEYDFINRKLKYSRIAINEEGYVKGKESVADF